MRPDQRAADQLRTTSIELHPIPYAEGSALITMGDTRVLCAASVEERVPPFRKGSGRGWITDCDIRGCETVDESLWQSLHVADFRVPQIGEQPP